MFDKQCRNHSLKLLCNTSGDLIEVLTDDNDFLAGLPQPPSLHDIMTVAARTSYYSFIDDIVRDGFAFRSDVAFGHNDRETHTFSLFGVLKEKTICIIAIPFPSHVFSAFDEFIKMLNDQGRLLRQAQKDAFSREENSARIIDTYTKLNNELLRTQRELEKKQNQLEHAYREIEALSREDSLTGVANRRFFIEMAEQELRRCTRYGFDVSMLYLDIDYFKAINDTFGHAAGDAALIRFAHECRDKLRKTDIFGRIGGEEFCVLLPHTSLEEALLTAERIRESVELIELEWENHIIRMTVSIGLARFNGNEAIGELLKRADNALYLAKSRGRNRIEFLRH